MLQRVLNEMSNWLGLRMESTQAYQQATGGISFMEKAGKLEQAQGAKTRDPALWTLLWLDFFDELSPSNT